VVDDDPELRRVLAMALADEGYDVRVASHGRAALELLQAWQPRLIVLDLMMPEMDGWAFRSRQIDSGSTDDVPVIILSAAPDMRVDALRPAAIFLKPFNLDDLLDTIVSLTG
jgi:DNA-binding response OmpR family regulator